MNPCRKFLTLSFVMLCALLQMGCVTIKNSSTHEIVLFISPGDGVAANEAMSQCLHVYLYNIGRKPLCIASYPKLYTFRWEIDDEGRRRECGFESSVVDQWKFTVLVPSTEALPEIYHGVSKQGQNIQNATLPMNSGCMSFDLPLRFDRKSILPNDIRQVRMELVFDIVRDEIMQKMIVEVEFPLKQLGPDDNEPFWGFYPHVEYKR